MTKMPPVPPQNRSPKGVGSENEMQPHDPKPGPRENLDEQGRQGNTAEHVERQIAVAIVIAVEELPSCSPCTGSSVASRSRMISFGARSCASRNKSTNSPLMAIGGTNMRAGGCGSTVSSASNQLLPVAQPDPFPPPRLPVFVTYRTS